MNKKLFSEILKNQINSSEYTTKQIYEICNASYSTVERWKSGKKYPEVHHLWRLSQVLHSGVSTKHHVKGCFFRYVEIIDSERK